METYTLQQGLKDFFVKHQVVNILGQVLQLLTSAVVQKQPATDHM